ncbi:universal stress protein [Nocardioides sp. zg-579]|uniref:Universal stress protein n=1 Tax=Nocardioides marmotae TaxID=2663857 RepID=A0A6I3JES1_9ACTN|nr:universal stress protein [Nocardioides marmotae]MCR6032960.1 universal stress protein [Gordonia jinghuaiqii]MTB96611.1 universal stress protein [Nocardioides marmotae]QKE01876.1 universal stress protein [Nocardioides marmotae]
MSAGPIVVGWTPDEFGATALERALAEARRRGLGVVTVNVGRGDALVDERFAHLEALDALEAELADSGVEHEVRQAVVPDVPDVAAEILHVANEVDAALVVLGLRRRSPVGKLLVGSVAQRVIRDARCPVIAVKPAEGPGDRAGDGAGDGTGDGVGG